MGGNQITTFNGPNGLSFGAFILGNADKVSWVNKVVAFEKLPQYMKYQHYIQKYNLLPGQRRRL